MKLDSGFENKRARVEMLPLIDVVFLLLVFFIYAMLSMAVQYGIKVNLAPSATVEVDRKTRINVTIKEDDSVYVNGDLTQMSQLIDRLTELKDADEAPVILNGDVKANLGAALEVFDMLREAGFTDVSIGYTKKQQ